MSRRTEAERFWTKVQAHNVTDCWQWIGTILSCGYGQFSLSGGKRIVAHHWFGKPSEGYESHHKCENKSCVNPFHIIELTKPDHRRLGPGICGRNYRKTHCLRGHAFSKENTHFHLAKNERVCRICSKERSARYRRRWRAKRKAAK